MAVDAGSINSSIRIAVADLARDVAKVEKLYDDLDGNVRTKSKNVESAINKVTAVQKQGALSQEEAIKRIINIRETELKNLQNLVAKKGTATKEELAQIDKVERELKNAKLAQDNYTKSQQKGTEETKDLTSATGEQNKSLINTALAFGAVTLAVNTAKKAISVFASTEQALANVEAVTNATREEMESLEDAALSAGESTRFTARNAADALFFLSSAGLDAQQSIDALDGVLTLAGATGSDLANTAKVVTATLSQFSLESDKASDVANIFAAANSNSQATLEKLQNALRQVGPIAGQFSISLEETTASLQALFNAGFAGEQSGVALRNILLTLSDASSDVSRAFIETGGSFEDINPRAVGLTAAIETLANSGIDLTEVFDKRAVGAILTLSKTAVDGEQNLRDFEKAVTGTSEAARQYAVQNDTLAGDFDKLKSAAEGSAIVFTEQFAPGIRAILNIITEILKAGSSLPSFFKGFGASATAASIGVFALSRAFTALLGPVGIVITAISAIAGGLISLKRASDQKVLDSLNEEFGLLAENLGYVGAEIDSFVKKAADVEQAFDVFGDPGNIENTLRIVEDLSAELDLSKQEIIAIAKESKNVSKEYDYQLDIIKDQVDEQDLLKKIEKDKSLLELKRASGQLSQVEILRERAKIAREEQELLEKAEAAEKLKEDSLNRQIKIKEEIKLLDELNLKGGISEIDLLNQKKSLREEEVKLLQNQALQSGEISKETIDNIRTQQEAIKIYEDRLKDLETQQKENAEKENEAGELSIDQYNQRIALIDEYVKTGLLSEKEAIEEKVKLSEAIIQGLKNQAQEEGVLSDEIKKNISEQLGFISAYTQEVKKVKEELKDIKDPSIIEEITLSLTANLDVIVGDTLKALGDSLTSAAKSANTEAEAYNILIEDTKSKIQEISNLETEINKEKQELLIEQVSNLKEEELDRLNRISEIEDSIGQKRLEVISLEEASAIEALNSKLAADIESINEKEKAELEAAGFTVKTKLDILNEQLKEEEDVQKRAEIKKEIEFQKIRDKFTKQRAEAEADAEKDIQAAKDAANTKRLEAEEMYGLTLDENILKQEEFSALEAELNNLKSQSKEDEIENLESQIETEKTLEDELAELKAGNYEAELESLEQQKIAAEEAGEALSILSTQLESITQGIIAFTAGDYLGGITEILTSILGPALENIGDFLKDNMTSELEDLAEKFEELGVEFSEVLGPLLLDLLILLEPFLSLAVEILSLALKFVPLLDFFIKINPQIKLLTLYATLLTEVFEELNSFAEFLAEELKPVEDFFQSIIDFVDALANFDLAGAGEIVSDSPVGDAVSSGAKIVKDLFGFETGGIVPQAPGTQSFGDQQLIRANPKELVLTEEQQSNLFDMIKSGNGSEGGTLTFNLNVEGQKLAEITAPYYNNGIVELEV